MANREQLRIIRAARAGDKFAQLALGRHYLFGGGGLPQNFATALHWLDRAAIQEIQEAWILIGTHISFDTAQRAALPRLLDWYQKAFDAGVVQAGLVLAQLAQARHDATGDTSMHDLAVRALQATAQAGLPDAQRLLAQQQRGNNAAAQSMARLSTAASPGPDAGIAEPDQRISRHALAERAWAMADYASFLRWSLPHARDLVRRSAATSG